MPDELPPPPDDDTASPVDPFEAELVAYLDGELEPAAARRVEVRLASDAEAREKATAFKKTFALLDFLPKPEPSPTFATRTIDKLPAVKSAVTVAGTSPPRTPITANTPPASISTSVPIALATGTIPLPSRAPAPIRWGRWAAGILIAVTACSAAGYFASSVARPYLFPAPSHDPNADDLALSDRRIVAMLPLYAVADDIEFVNELAKPEFFGDEPAVAYDFTLKPSRPVDLDKQSSPAFDSLHEAFKALPPARQQAIRELDKQLHEQDDPDHLTRVLEVYAGWLDRLPEAARKDVLAATTPTRRLEEVRNLRDKQWIDELPVAQRTKLKGLPADDKADLIRMWKDEEAQRRDDWAFIRNHAPDVAANKTPWPFDTEAGKKDTIEFMRVAFRIDDPKKCRFKDYELNQYTSTLTTANKEGGAAWLAYGKYAYDLTKRYELLPEPAGREPITNYFQLGPTASRLFDKDKGPGHKATQAHVGKWPDFALEVNRYATGMKSDRLLPPMGPAKPAEFKEPLRSFVTDKLMPILNSFERRDLVIREGKWPDYPREMIRLSKQHDLSAPGLMLPDSPKRWETIYASPRPRPGPGGPGPR